MIIRAIAEVDVVIAPEAASTAKTMLAAIAATSRYGALVVFVAGGVWWPLQESRGS